MKKIIIIISILFIAFNSFGQANSGKVIVTKVGGGVGQHYVDSLFSLGYTKAQVDSAIAANIGGGGGISQLGDGGYFLTKPNDSTYNFDSSHASAIYIRRKDSGVSYYSPYLLQSTYATIANMAKKYDSTQFIVNTTFLNDMQTNGSGFTNFNGATSSYDGTNKRLTVVASTSIKGVYVSGNPLVDGHRYTVQVNVDIGTTDGINIVNKYATTLYTIRTSGTYYYTFIAQPADAFGNQTVYLYTGKAGTFYVKYFRIQEVPINFEYVTRGDVQSMLPAVNTIGGGVVIGNSAKDSLINSVTNTSVLVGKSAYSSKPNSVVIGESAQSYNSPFASSTNGEGVAIGYFSMAGDWRATAVGARSQALAVSNSAFGYGTYINVPHGNVSGRGGYNTLGGTLFYSDATGSFSGHSFYFGSQDASHTNPAMPGGETVDFSAGLNAGTLFTVLRGYGGIDTKPTPTLTNTRGGTMRIAGGASTSQGVGGDVELAVTPATATSGNVTNPDSVILRVSALRQSVAIGNVGNTKPTPDTSAKFDVQSLTKGVLFPRMTTTQWNAIPLRATSLHGYDLTVNKPVWYDGIANRYPRWTTDSLDVSFLNKNIKIDTSNLPITNIHTGRGVGHSNDSTLITQAHVYSQSSVATLTINADTTDMAILTTQAVGLTIANPTGTLLDGQRLVIRIYTSSVQTIGFGTKFRFGANSPAPTATLSTSTMYMEFIYNSDDDTLDMLNPYNTF